MKVTLIRSRAIGLTVNIHKWAKTLSENGYSVKLLVWDREGKKGVEGSNGYTICRFGFKAPRDKLTALFYLPVWWAYEFLFLLRDDSDVINAFNLDTLIPALLIKLVKRFRLCYTIYDFYSDNLPTQIPSVIRNCVASVEKFGIRFTDSLFLVDETRYEQVRGARIKRAAYIYNSPYDYFNPQILSRSASEVLIFHAGKILKTEGLEHMISAIRDLDDVKLVIAGVGPDKDILAQPSLPANFQYIGWIPYEEVIRRELEADIFFAFYDIKIPNNKYASPNKLFEAMMCGKPIIVSDGSSMADIVRKENCGLVVPYGDVDSIREAVLKLKNDLQLRQTLGKDGRKAYEEKYSWHIMEQRLLDAYKQLSNC
jgi:glycosyltransferase involved in cell wall biosynthesis